MTTVIQDLVLIDEYNRTGSETMYTENKGKLYVYKVEKGETYYIVLIWTDQ